MPINITTAVIPAAGKGSRIADLPLTRILPKPLLPLLNKPIVEHIIDWLKKIGIRKIYFIVSFKKEIFKEYFGDGRDFGVKIEYIQCPNPKNIGGLADGIYLASKFINNPFMVVLGDDFTITGSFKSLVKGFFKKNALALEAVVKENNPDALSRACEVNLDSKGRIIGITEKPEKPRWSVRGCGIYIFDPIVFDFIKKTPVENRKRDITKTIQIMAKRTGRVYGVMVDKNININTLADLQQASLALLKKERI